MIFIEDCTIGSTIETMDYQFEVIGLIDPNEVQIGFGWVRYTLPFGSSVKLIKTSNQITSKQLAVLFNEPMAQQ